MEGTPQTLLCTRQLNPELGLKMGPRGGHNDLAPGFYLTLTDLVTRMVDSKRSRSNRIKASKRNSD